MGMYLWKRVLVKQNALCIFRQYSSRNVLKYQDKGLFQDIFPSTSANEVIDLFNGGPQTVYAGFDPTAKSLHVGNLLVLVNLLHWQRGGHHVIALIGGGTGRIGDPSGRNKERQEQAEEIVKTNVNYISAMINKIFENHKKYFCDEKISLKPLINFIAQTAIVAETESDPLKRITITAFLVISENYELPILYQLVGGSDQMGNIMTGHELISRVTDKSVYGLTLPLITTESGDKFGKSAGNAIWLDPQLTPPFELYQFFMRLPDAKVSQILSLLTFLTAGEVKDLVSKHMEKPELKKAQKYLAEKITLLVHGDKELTIAENTTKALYSRDISALAALSFEEISVAFRGAQLIEMLLRPGLTVLEAALSARCFLSQNDAERIIKAGGFHINHQKSMNPSEMLVKGVHILPNQLSLFRVGKKNYWIIKWLS